MNQPVDGDRDRGISALRAAGVGLGLLGATMGGVAGWFTLAPQSSLTSAVSVPARTGVEVAVIDTGRVGLGTAGVHTRTGGP